MQVPTTDQLRDDIDSGRTGEKVAMPDPAAAPLGTDAEAAGTPPTESERASAAAAAPRPHNVRHPPNGVIVYLALVVGVSVALVGIVLLALA